MAKKYVPSGYQIINISVENLSDEIANNELLNYCKKSWISEDVKPLLLKVHCDELNQTIISIGQTIIDRSNESVSIFVGSVYVDDTLTRICINYDPTTPDAYPILISE